MEFLPGKLTCEFGCGACTFVSDYGIGECGACLTLRVLWEAVATIFSFSSRSLAAVDSRLSAAFCQPLWRTWGAGEFGPIEVEMDGLGLRRVVGFLVLNVRCPTS